MNKIRVNIEILRIKMFTWSAAILSPIQYFNLGLIVKEIGCAGKKCFTDPDSQINLPKRK